MIVLDVQGVPAPKGSNRAMMRGGHAVMVPGSSDTGRRRMVLWERAVRDEAREAICASLHPLFTEVPVAVAIIFRLPRPKTGKRLRPSVKPDIDKLARATLDALTGLAFDDDSRIVELALHKTYAEPGDEGASIYVREWIP